MATIESVIIGISRIANTSRKTHVKWERVVHSYTHKKESIYQSKRNRYRKDCENVACNILSAHSHSHDDFFQPFVSSPKQHMYVSL